MGRPRETGKPNSEQRIQHFSHEHPLKLFNIQERPLHFATCSGCKAPPSAMVYGCKPCNYILHISCSQMPQLIRHPVDPNHSLTLLLQPAYPDGKFRCDACGVEGNGFCYHCRTCGLDIHILCATMPLCVTHQTHPHPLNLAFSPPYIDKTFYCDICRNQGSDHWVYRCNSCGFDAHLNCATSKSPPAPSVHQHQHQTRSPLPQSRYNSFPTANHQFHQSTAIGASQRASQNFLQGFIDQQQANQEAILKIMQGNNPEAELNDLIRGIHGGNNAAELVAQQQQLQDNMLQQIMGAHNGRIGAAPAFGQGFMQNMSGGNGGGSGAIQQVTQSVLQNVMGGNDGGIGAGVASSIIQGMFGL